MNEEFYSGLLESLFHHLTSLGVTIPSSKRDQAMHAAKLVTEGKTIKEALTVIDDENIREAVRTFLYVGLIRGIIRAVETEGRITHEQAEDYVEYLNDTGNFPPLS